MNKDITLQQLEDKGYVPMLWHVDDVKNTYNVTDEEARKILMSVLDDDFLRGDIFSAIDSLCLDEYEEVE